MRLLPAAPPRPQQLHPAAPALIRMPLLPAARLPRILRPAAPLELTRTQPLPAAPPPLTRALLLLTRTRTPPQPTTPRRLTRTQTRARNCPRPLLRCRCSACWDSGLLPPASLAAKRNNNRSST